MLCFREFLDIKSILQSIKDKSLGYTRRSMPQIHSDKLPDLLKFLKTKNISSQTVKIEPCKYNASQNQFNDEKISNLMKSSNNKPILVSSDNYVIDGHHRWLSTHINNIQTNSRQTMKAIKINTDAEQLIKLLRNCDHAGFKKVSEEVNGNGQCVWSNSL